ncbi:MAG: CBS domain-containing protein [Flavobacteriales bacterium]|nr:CBS domain-containing protein [Flavobacteriales bacterium]
MGIVTEPDFTEVSLDSEVQLRRKEKAAVPEPERTEAHNELLHFEEGLDDLGPTIGTLESAGGGLVSVDRQDPISKAVGLMMTYDYSQLPVMQGSRRVDGLISWLALGQAWARGDECTTVAECMLPPPTFFKYNDSLFKCIPTIIDEEVVLVRGQDDSVTGLVTTADLSMKFRELSEAFLLLGKIESLIRQLMNGKFTLEMLQEAKDPSDVERRIEGLTDMTFGEYVRLLDHDDRWAKLGLRVDRKTVMERLKRVNAIRNDVMHFNPDGPDEEEMEVLRSMEHFLSRIVR